MKKTLKDKAANSARNSKTIMKKDKTGKQNGKKVTWKNGAAIQHKGFANKKVLRDQNVSTRALFSICHVLVTRVARCDAGNKSFRFAKLTISDLRNNCLRLAPVSCTGPRHGKSSCKCGTNAQNLSWANLTTFFDQFLVVAAVEI